MLTNHSNALQPESYHAEDGPKRRTHKHGQVLNFFYILITWAFGICLLTFPWSNLWENNYLLYLYPQIRPVVANPFFKGAVLGLGIANIMIGLDEIGILKHLSKGRSFR
jgi:hypothetical protein